MISPLARTSVQFALLLPVWALALLGGLTALALGAALWRRTPGAILRAAAACVILLWASGPQMLAETVRKLPQTVLLLTDRTASMSLRQRAAIADATAASLAAELPPDTRLRRVDIPASPTGGTRLFAALESGLADIPAGQLAGVVALTDGQVHDAPAQLPARLGAGAGQAPLSVLIPAAGEEHDRRLRILEAPPYAIVGKVATIRVQIDDLGPDPDRGATAELRVHRAGGPDTARSVAVGEPQTLEVPIDHAGPTLIELEAAPLTGEVSDVNNRATLRINGVRDKLRVLLISGAPNQGERVWRRLLKADPSVELVHFTILRPPDKDDLTPLSELALIQFPVRTLFQDKIDQFDLIILDQFDDSTRLPDAYLANIADFVRQGGGLLMTAGPEFIGPGSLQDTPLGDILPVHVPVDGGLHEQRLVPELTELGRRHPVTADLPGVTPSGTDWGPWYRELLGQTPREGSETLMSGPTPEGGRTPLLVLDHVEQGRVAMLLSDQIWLWSRGEGGGGPQAELLRRLSHWLMKEPQLDEEQLDAAITDGTLTVTRRSAASSPVETVRVHHPDGTVTPLPLAATTPGTATAALPAAAPGIWEIEDGTRHAWAAAAESDALELSDLRATAERLAPLARGAAGSLHFLGSDPAHPAVPALRVVGPGDAAGGPGWIGLRPGNATALTGARATALLPAWVALPLALLLLMCGWWREARRS